MSFELFELQKGYLIEGREMGKGREQYNYKEYSNREKELRYCEWKIEKRDIDR